MARDPKNPVIIDETGLPVISDETMEHPHLMRAMMGVILTKLTPGRMVKFPRADLLLMNDQEFICLHDYTTDELIIGVATPAEAEAIRNKVAAWGSVDKSKLN